MLLPFIFNDAAWVIIKNSMNIFFHGSQFLKGTINLFTNGVFRYLIALLFMHLSSLCIAQQKFDFYVSNNGNDSFPGTSNQFPKKTIAATSPALESFSHTNQKIQLGLKGGDIFEEGLITSYPVEINTYADNVPDNKFAILNGTKEFGTGWLKEAGKMYTFSQPVPYNGFVGYGIGAIGGFSFICVFEIDRELEKTAPFTARKVLKFLSNQTDIENTPGSFYTPVTNDNPIPVYIHTSDGGSPNDNKKYRYEITVRDWGVNSTYQPNSRFENLWVRGFGAGNGMLPGGDNSYYNKIIFGPGAGIHHLGVRSGTINHSLFLPGAQNTSAFALIFYDAEGLGRHCYIKNSMFLDIPAPVYAHTSYGTNYGTVEMDNVVGFADSVLVGSFMTTSNSDTVLLNNIYADGFYSGYNYANAVYAAISNSCFKDVQFGIAFNDAYNAINAIIENVFVKTKATGFASGIIIQNRTTVNLHHSIVHISNTNYNNPNTSTGSFVSGTDATANKIIASGNIFICDVDPSGFLTAAVTNTDDGIATSKDSWDNNVYILLRGKNIQWSVTNPSTNGGNYTIDNFDDWKKQSGQDQHSLFFDLRNDARGLKAIFQNPENGDYNLANTKEGDLVASLHAGMTDAISCFLKRPSYEQAAELIRTGNELSVKTCRNPCTQNSIKVNATFELDSISNRQVELKWNIAEQNNIDRYIVQKKAGNANFKIISSIPSVMDSLYVVTDNIQPGIDYQYRLVVIAKSGNKCYSDIKTIKSYDSRPFTIFPSPSNGKIFISMNGYIGRISFIVYNSIGEIVLKKESVSLYAAQALDLSNQPGGVYSIKIVTAGGSFVQNIILL